MYSFVPFRSSQVTLEWIEVTTGRSSSTTFTKAFLWLIDEGELRTFAGFDLFTNEDLRER